MKHGKSKGLKSGNGDMLLFSLPALAFVAFATLIPFCMNLYYAMYEWNGVSQQKTFVGFANFIKIFTNDRTFRESIGFTVKFTLLFVVLVNVLAIAIAYALSQSAKVAHVFRSFYFIPYIISMVAISLIWKCILGPGFNMLYDSTGFSFFGQSWLGSPSLVYFTVVFISVWQNVGYYMVIYIAGFTATPTDVLEAASVDGATGFTRFRRIQLPLLMPSITICTFTSLTYSFKLFDIILVLTKGGPAGSSTTVAFDIYNNAFADFNYGIATAKSLVFFVAVLLVTVVQLKFFKSKEVNY